MHPNTEVTKIKEIIGKVDKTYQEISFVYEIFLKTRLFEHIEPDHQRFQKFIDYLRYSHFSDQDTIISPDIPAKGIYILLKGTLYKFQKMDNFRIYDKENTECYNIKNEEKKQKLYIKELVKKHGVLVDIIKLPFTILDSRVNNRIFISRHDSEFLFIDFEKWNKFSTFDYQDKKRAYFRQHYPFFINLEERKMLDCLQQFDIEIFEHGALIDISEKIYFLFEGNLLVIDEQRNYQQLKHNLRKSLFQINKLNKIKISYILEGDVVGIKNYISNNQFQYEVNSSVAKFYSIRHDRIRYLSREWIYFFEFYEKNSLNKEREFSRINRQKTSRNLIEFLNKTNHTFHKKKTLTKQELEDKQHIDKLALTFNKLQTNWKQIRKVKEGIQKKQNIFPTGFIQSEIQSRRQSRSNSKEKHLTFYKSHSNLLAARINKLKSKFLQEHNTLNSNKHIKFNLFNQTFQ